MFEFSVRRLLRHWSLNLSVLLGLTLGSALLASLPGYANAIAVWSLQQSFITHSATDRNIEISADLSVPTAGINSYINETIAGMVTSRLVVQKATSLTSPVRSVTAADGSDRLQPESLTLWSFYLADDVLDLVSGSWPAYSEPPAGQETQRPVIQAVISQSVAKETGLQLGDRIKDLFGNRYSIVGIITQKDPRSEIWMDDPTPFHITVIPGTNEDKHIIPLIIDPSALQDTFSGSSTRSWRLLIDHGLFTPKNSQAWEDKLLSLKNLLQADHATLISSLPDILLTFRHNQATIRMVLLLAGMQSFIFVLYTLALISSSVLERTQGEISTIVGRGASSWQLVKLLAMEAGYMVLLVGCLLGPLTSWLGLNAWARATGSSLSFAILPETFYFSLIGAGLGWISLMLGTIPLVRRTLLDWQRRLSRPKRSGPWSKLYVDIFLLVFAALVFWQLSTNGSFVIKRVSALPQADPLFLLSPTILLITVSLVLLRIFPYLLRGFAYLSRSMRSLVLPLGLSRLARNPLRPNQIILLIGVAFGMMVFMTTYDHSLGSSQEQVAHYQAGSDLRITQGRTDKEDFQKLPGVIQVSPVLRINLPSNTGSLLTLLALDAPTLAQVAYYPPGFSGISMETIAQALSSGGSESDPVPSDGQSQGNPNYARTIPAIYSQAALPAGKGIGDIIPIQVRSVTIYLEVKGVVANFPTLTRGFILVDHTAFFSHLNLPVSYLPNNSEFWLEIDPALHEPLIASLKEGSTILADAHTELVRLQNNAFTEGARRAFVLNAYTLAVLSIAGFILLNFFSAQQRLYEFGVLRAHGMTVGQVNALLVSEGLLIIILGSAVGAGIGLGLVYSMRVFLNTALVSTYPGAGVYQVNLDWTRISALTGLLLLAYLVAILVFMLISIKSGVHRMIKIGEE